MAAVGAFVAVALALITAIAVVAIVVVVVIVDTHTLWIATNNGAMFFLFVLAPCIQFSTLYASGHSNNNSRYQLLVGAFSFMVTLFNGVLYLNRLPRFLSTSSTQKTCIGKRNV